MLELAKECKVLDIFTHVSTAYTNCNRGDGLIEEKIYDQGLDSEAKVAELMAMNPQQIADNEKQLIGSFPNTYTFTKNLAEKTLLKNKGNLTVCLFRPSIIAASHLEPFPGWTDSLAAAGGISMLTGIGLIHYIRAHGTNKFDITPVDFVTNGMIIATAYGTTRPKELIVYHSGTSSTNSITMVDYKHGIEREFRIMQFDNQVSSPIFLKFIASHKKFKATKMIKEKLPIYLLEKAAQLPWIGTP